MRKFSEAIDNFSTEKVDELIEQIKDYSTDVDTAKGKLDDMKIYLTNYRSDSGDSNDQIDNSVSNLELIISKLSEAITLMDTVHSDLKDYDEKGRQFLI